MKYYYLYAEDDKELALKVITYIKSKEIEVEPVDIEKLEELTFEDEAHLLVTASVDGLKRVMHLASQKSLTLGIVARSNQKELKSTFDLSSDLEESVDMALNACPKKIDLLYCNEELVLQEVVVGEVPPLDSFSTSMEKLSFWERLNSSFSIIKKIKSLKHTYFTVTTAKEKVLKFSAIGAVGVEYNNRTFASKLVSNYLKFNDARFTLIVLSPRSLVEYVGYIFQSHILKQTPKSLPTSVGYVHAHRLELESKEELEVAVDGIKLCSTPVVLETKAEALSLSVGEKFWEKSSKVKEIKESVKVDHLPCDSELSGYLESAIPLFSHASQEQFTSLFTNLREESRLNSTFMTLLILATLIATFGLYINSASVIIGAMLLAPLMQPIVGVSMGLLRQDEALLLNGAKSIGVGVLAVLFSAMVITWFLPLHQLTSEMNGRLSPTLLDLFVAIVSGMAAAYAKSNEKIVGSLAGVAIAVALVPPIAVAGIGLGWGEFGMFGSAFLLFVTNLVGIVLAASLTFLMLGFSPVAVAKKGLFYSLVLVAIVAVPLSVSFSHMQREMGITQELIAFKTELNGKKIHLKNIDVQGKEIRCEVIASDILSKEEKVELKSRISQKVGEEVRVLVSFWYEL